ncbi:hypothetical protein SEA_TIERRA_39 [Mycobacterium phage Tierra]|uniref:Uncharacterized protein n=1 Tax=Mycobacterium phage Bryler TaxID=2653755 RepID=A0A5Q2WMB8_9CAUD|nr:hypothetical protein I5G79_gp58 [Mycobacterium phage Bryler]ASR85338.1 hypothetical protein SEA_PHRANK_39 [Mycobacterium phage Phrank]ASR85439.1 hypothetical protein SEA_CAIN_39 [Mycobacterium phage Cain]QGH80415.1 hypothetical protein SEA_BRYLER_39 [Mycobacterium phage Bryler]WNM68328.1 hypothetical protein SEA_TIERRA_39 [Mycobacterium phage Tierra]
MSDARDAARAALAAWNQAPRTAVIGPEFADAGRAMAAAIDGLLAADVWVLDVSCEGPEGGDYDGWQSVHAGRDGAIGRLVEKLVEYGLGDVEPQGSAIAENGSMAGDYEVDGKSVSYGVHRMPVEP